jgi:opacity protein-like surface antigen
MAFRRNSWFSELPGQLRVEFEARGRDQVVATETLAGDTIAEQASDGWSTMINVWRDNKFSEKWGYYIGAGIGAGGYRSNIEVTAGPPLISNNENISAFAWQAGTGLIWEISDRTTLDLGYRFFSINNTTATLDFAGTPTPYKRGYSASELLLSVRIYEPFRRFMK